MMNTGPTTTSVTRAVIDGDLILRISGGDTEIGPMPKGIGLERLRFDGKGVVDLFALDEMWVENKGGVWILHCISLPGCQRVKMTYSDRWRLTNDAGTYRLLSQDEIAKEEAKALARSRAETVLAKVIEGTDKAILIDGIRLLFAFILAEREPNKQLGDWLNSQLPSIKATFTWSADDFARLEKLIASLREAVKTNADTIG